MSSIYFPFLVMEIRNLVRGLQVAQDPKHKRIITEELVKEGKVNMTFTIGGKEYILRIRETDNAV